MAKEYGHQIFNLADGDYIHCWTTETRNGFCHHSAYYAPCGLIETRRVSYLNRTWKSFRYETCLLTLANKMPKPERLAIQSLCVKEAQNAHAEAERFVKAFSGLWNSLDEKKQAKVAKALGPDGITNKTQASAAMAMMAAMA